MQTKLERLQKQILLNTEITAIMKQSNRLMDIVKENQEEVNELKAECDRLDEKALGLEDDTAVQHGIKCANDFFESRLK